MARALDRNRQQTLVTCTRTNFAARFDFAVIGQKAAQLIALLVINRLDFLRAEWANPGWAGSAKATATALTAVSIWATATAARSIG